jgi:hypothetical protein
VNWPRMAAPEGSGTVAWLNYVVVQHGPVLSVSPGVN